ncbi:hypothetical protein EMCRGX_G005432 [Ephydatia muelleri]
MASSSHVSLPKPFASGNISEWFTRFDICSNANEWDDDKKVVKLPKLLEGVAFAAWLDLSLEERKEYKTMKEKLIARMAPSNFITMEEFRDRKLRPSEALSLYLHDLRQLIDRAMPKLDLALKEQLILHQFIAGLPATINRQLRATGDMTNLQSTLECAKLLLSLEEEQKVAAVTPQMGSSCHNVERLVEQVAALTEQVAALSARSRDRDQRPVRCYNCGTLGHMRRNCQQQQQGNYNGTPAKGHSRPAHQKNRRARDGHHVGFWFISFPLERRSNQRYERSDEKKQGLLLDFRTTPVTVLSTADATKAEAIDIEEDEVLLKNLLANSHKIRNKTCSAINGANDEEVNKDIVEECAIPVSSDLAVIEPPQYVEQKFEAVVKEFGDLFSTQTGRTNMTSHHINTTGSPLRVPARRIPVHFREEIEKQIKFMLEKGVIEESCSLWTARAVYVRKKTGQDSGGFAVVPLGEDGSALPTAPVCGTFQLLLVFFFLLFCDRRIGTFRSRFDFSTGECGGGAPLIVSPCAHPHPIPRRFLQKTCTQFEE